MVDMTDPPSQDTRDVVGMALAVATEQPVPDTKFGVFRM